MRGFSTTRCCSTPSAAKSRLWTSAESASACARTARPRGCGSAASWKTTTASTCAGCSGWFLRTGHVAEAKDPPGVAARGRRGGGPAALGRELHRPRSLPERVAARQGQPRPGLAARPAGKVTEHHADAGRPGRRHAEDRQALRAAAPGHAGDRPAGVAVGRRQPLRRPAPGAAARARHPRRRHDRRARHDDGGRPRPALQHVRPEPTRQSLSSRPPGLAPPARRPRRADERGLRVPQPVAVVVEPAVPRAQPRHAAARALRRLELASSSPTSPTATTTSPASSTTSPRRPRRSATSSRRSPTPIGQLPPFMRRANTTFLNLRATLDDLDPLVDESKPVAKKLRPFMAELRPLAQDARPDAARPLAARSRRPAQDNDLIDLTLAAPRCATSTTGEVSDHGKERRRRVPEPRRRRSRAARRSSASWRPYTRRPARLVRRLQPLRRLRRARRRLARRASTPARSRWPTASCCRSRPSCAARRSRPAPTLNQRNRCPGAAEHAADDGSNPYKPTAGFNCDPSQTLPASAVTPPARHRRSLLARRRRARRRRRRRGRRDAGQAEVHRRARQRVRHRQRRRPQGRRRARGQDHRPAPRPAHEARAGRLRGHPGRLRLAARRHVLRDPPAVADRRVLHRLPTPAQSNEQAEARRHDPGRAHRVDDPASTSSTTSCAGRSASACRSSSTSSAPASAGRVDGPQRGDPPRGAGAARDRPRAGHARPTRTRRSSS